MIAIALFLVLDLGVLIFNVRISRQFESDTVQINAGGEMRMYSQQLTKALLTLQSETAAELPNQTSMAQISESVQAFRNALLRLKIALHQAGADRAADAPEKQDDADPETWQRLQKVENYWKPMDEVVVPLQPADFRAVGKFYKSFPQITDRRTKGFLSSRFARAKRAASLRP